MLTQGRTIVPIRIDIKRGAHQGDKIDPKKRSRCSLWKYRWQGEFLMRWYLIFEAWVICQCVTGGNKSDIAFNTFQLLIKDYKSTVSCLHTAIARLVVPAQSCCYVSRGCREVRTVCGSVGPSYQLCGETRRQENSGGAIYNRPSPQSSCNGTATDHASKPLITVHYSRCELCPRTHQGHPTLSPKGPKNTGDKQCRQAVLSVSPECLDEF